MTFIQDKYKNKTFEEILQESQNLVKLIADYYWKADWVVRVYHDSEPFISKTLGNIRGLDILTAKKGKTIFIDAKDFGRLIYIKPFCTGLPKILVNRYRRIKKEFGFDCYLYFRDNETIEERWPSSFKNNEVYLPYGGEIDSFILHQRQDIKCSWLNWENQLQELWNLDTMQSIEDILLK